MPNPHSNSSFGGLHTYGFNSTIFKFKFNGFSTDSVTAQENAWPPGLFPASQDGRQAC